MKVVGVLLLLTGLTVTLILRFSPVMGSNRLQSEVFDNLSEKVAPVQWAPAIGSVLIVAGTAIVVAGRRKKKTIRQMPKQATSPQREPNGRKIRELQMNNASRIFYARKNSVH